MKKILILLILLSSVVLLAAENRKVDVYFANGILTKQRIAKDNAYLLEGAIKNKLVSTYNKQIGKVAYSYNNTHGMGFDVIESLDQKLNVVKWKDWLAGLVGYVTSHASDLKEQIDAYKASIDNGHGVLVVAHSQGNLFTKEAYDALDPCMQKQFEAVSIASPMHADIKEARLSITDDITHHASM